MLDNINVLGVITARYQSTRFPGKPCADILGRPMIVWVYERSKLANIENLLVATDDERIKKVCIEYKIPFIMTSKQHQTSGDRVAEVSSKITSKIVIEIQGDEPLVHHDILNELIKQVENYEFDVVNSYMEITEDSEIYNQNVVKVVLDTNECALFLSRYPVPFSRSSIPYFKQQGFYCYRRESILSYPSLKVGYCEKAEGIALLRFLENNRKVKMIYSNKNTFSVDIPSDIQVVEKYLSIPA